jgi:hypothetical protein
MIFVEDMKKKMEKKIGLNPQITDHTGRFRFGCFFFPTPTGSIHATKQQKHEREFSIFGPPPPLGGGHC